MTDDLSDAEWPASYQILIELYERAYPEKKLKPLLDSVHLRRGGPAFWGDLRLRANVARQNIRKRRTPNTDVYTERDLSTFKKSQLLHDLLRLQFQNHHHPSASDATMMAKTSTKKKPKDDSDDDTPSVADASFDRMADKFDSWGGVKGSSVKSKGKGPKITPLAMGVIGNNPLGIKLTMGADRRKTDDGLLSVSGLYISLPLYDVRDMDHTTVELDTKNETDEDGNSSIITVTRPVVSVAELDSNLSRLSKFGIETVAHYKGNTKGIESEDLETTNHTRIQNGKAAHTKLVDQRTQMGRKVSYSFKLPLDKYGNQIYVNNKNWQGANHTDKPDDANYLSPAFMPTVIKYEYNNRKVSAVFMSLDYEVPMVGYEESNLDSMLTPLKKANKQDVVGSKIDDMLGEFYDDAEYEDDNGMDA